MALLAKRSLVTRLARLEAQSGSLAEERQRTLMSLRDHATDVMTRAGLAPDPWQQRVLTSTMAQMLLLCTRQAGKSTVAAALAVRAALLQPGALVLVLSPSLRQSGELFRKVLGYDAANQLTLETDAYGNFLLVRTTTMAYDSLSHVTSVTDPLGAQTTYAYDVLGRLTGMTAAAGTGLAQQTSYGYDLNDNQTSVTDALGHTTTTAYDALNRVIQAIDALGHTTATYLYDAAGNLLSTTDARGSVTSFAYDALNRVIEEIDALGVSGLQRTTTVAYDSAGNVLSTTDPLGNVTSYGYDALNRTTQEVDAWGVSGLQRTTTTTYDAADNVLTVTDPLGHVTSYGYDALDRLTATTEAVGVSGVQRTTTVAYDAGDHVIGATDALGVHTSYAYDDLGRLYTQTDAAGTALQRTTTLAYDADDNLIASTDPLGHTTTFVYDTLNRQTVTIDAASGRTTVGYDLADNVHTTTDPLGHTTTLAYDADNRLISSTDPLTHTTTLAYDNAGDLIAQTDPLNHTTTFGYDILGRQTTVRDALNNVTTYLYDADDNQTGLINPLGNRGTMVYDALNRLIAQTDALGHTTTTTYDAADNVLTVTDPLNHTTTYSYDALNRQITATDPTSGTTTTLYDADDRVTGTVDPLGHRTTAVFDTLGRATQTIDGDGGVTTLQYDAADNLTGLTDPNGNHTTFAYDVLNRQTSMTDPLNHTATYAYDAAGRLTGTTDRDGMSLTYSYDAAGHLTGETMLSAGHAVQDLLTFAYDAAGNQTGAKNTSGAYTLTYDAADQVTHVAEPFGLGLTMVYDAAGNRTKVTDSLGGVATSVYDAANRLSTREFGDTSGAVLRYDYSYTADDQIASLTHASNLAGTTHVGVTSMAYDAAGRTTLIQQVNGSSSVFQTTTYSYDAAGRMTAEKTNGTTTSYSYDAANQLTAAGATTYAYDSAGNRTSGGSSPSTGNQISQDANFTYSYDADGNRTGKTSKSDGSRWVYAYNAADQMTLAEHFDSSDVLLSQVTYVYDAWGNLIERDDYEASSGTGDGGGEDAMGALGGFSPDLGIDIGETITRFGQDGWKVSQDFWGQRQQATGLSNFDVWVELNATSGSNVLATRRFYGDGIDTPVARINYTSGTGAVAWYFTDVRDSVTAVANASGTVEAQISYDGYGNATVTGANTSYADAYQYTGRPTDAATDLQDNRGRWYDPTTGTFTVEDPTGFNAGDYNLMRYVDNGPTDHKDPSGLSFGDYVLWCLYGPYGHHWVPFDSVKDANIWSVLSEGARNVQAGYWSGPTDPNHGIVKIFGGVSHGEYNEIVQAELREFIRQNGFTSANRMRAPKMLEFANAMRNGESFFRKGTSKALTNARKLKAVNGTVARTCTNAAATDLRSVLKQGERFRGLSSRAIAFAGVSAVFGLLAAGGASEEMLKKLASSAEFKAAIGAAERGDLGGLQVILIGGGNADPFQDSHLFSKLAADLRTSGTNELMLRGLHAQLVAVFTELAKVRDRMDQEKAGAAVQPQEPGSFGAGGGLVGGPIARWLIIALRAAGLVDPTSNGDCPPP